MSDDKATTKQKTSMPKAPWLFVSGLSAEDRVDLAEELAYIIPNAQIRFEPNNTAFVGGTHGKNVVIFVQSEGSKSSCNEEATNVLQSQARASTINFVTIDLVEDIDQAAPAYIGNKLTIAKSPRAAEKVYKALFNVFTIRESLYLIPEAQMVKIDKLFPEYKYCPIKEVGNHPKDAKLQFVALVLEKPQIVEGKKLIWTVADRTGVVKFYFQWRGKESQYTWDWVLNLKPGQRVCLPRMPMVKIMEKKRMRLVKAPLRLGGAVFNGTGLIIGAVGKGFCKVGKAMSLGKSSEWVPEADVGAHGKKINWSKQGDAVNDHKSGPQPKAINVFNEKGEKAWDDTASVASTNVGSDDEKSGKDFL